MASFGTGVISGEATDVEWGTAAATITAGQAVYKSQTTGQWSPAQSDATGTLGQAGIKKDMGVALGGAAAGQRLQILLRGYITGASSLAPGGIYCVSDTVAGDVILSASLTEDTDYACVMGVAVTATTAYINPINSNVVVNLV